MVPESRFESLETFLQTFLLHPLNRGGKADLSRSLLAIHQKLHEPSFWELKDCFVLLATQV